MSGSRRWPATAWRELLRLALTVFDDAGVGEDGWTFGGGSALALTVGHRVSYDIDLFVGEAAVLHGLSLNRNRAARSATGRWQEPGNSIKLELEQGAVDFILAGAQTTLPPRRFRFEGRTIRVEQPAEILAKKLRFRSSRLLPRDIFDLLAVNRYDQDELRRAAAAVPGSARRAADRIRRIADRYRDTIADEVNPTNAGVDLLEVDPLDVAKILEQF